MLLASLCMRLRLGSAQAELWCRRRWRRGARKDARKPTPSPRATGLTPEEFEARITAPIEFAVRGAPRLVRMRSTTRYSIARLAFAFAEGVDIHCARRSMNGSRRGPTNCRRRKRRPDADRATPPRRFDDPTNASEIARWRPTSMLRGFVRSFEVAPSLARILNWRGNPSVPG